jgi:chromosome partitioning protein
MLPAMPSVVSVINYKGGVGKTTLTANIGAELARRGRTVLLIDLDPQASLTFSFFTAELWERDLSDCCTLLQWFGTVLDRAPKPLRGFVLTPPVVNDLIGQHGGGRLDLLASHLGLIDVDLDIAAELSGSRFQHGAPDYLRLHRCLADALKDEAFDEYDVILIDCAPNFTMVTRTGIVASEHILVPARPDYLSTLGMDYLRRKLSELVRDFNKVAERDGVEVINPTILGAVLTMIQHGASGPITVMRNYINHAANIEMPVFTQTLRESKTTFGALGEQSVPAALATNVNVTVQYELRELVNEFLAKIRI